MFESTFSPGYKDRPAPPATEAGRRLPKLLKLEREVFGAWLQVGPPSPFCLRISSEPHKSPEAVYLSPSLRNYFVIFF